MRISYQDRHALGGSSDQKLQLFRRLFAHLLVMLDGDADQALDTLERLGERHGLFDEQLTPEELRKQLLQERIIQIDPTGRSKLTGKGENFVRTQTLDDIFRGVKLDISGGDHPTPFAGRGTERTTETRSYQFGDELGDIDFLRSYQNAFQRAASTEAVLQEEDLEVYETERRISVATCLLLDISHSMVLYGEDRITPAKRVALALAELIRRKYPKDALHIILFGDFAREVSLRDLTYTGVGPYHTNTHQALQMARRILTRKKQANKQVFMITDGKPTALIEGGELYLNSMGLDPKIRAKTLGEAAECRRHGIPITTFMIAQDPWLVRFVEDLTRINKGRAFFASLDRLEQTVFVDFMNNRRKNVR